MRLVSHARPHGPTRDTVDWGPKRFACEPKRPSVYDGFMPADSAPDDPVLDAAIAQRQAAQRRVEYWDRWIKQYQELKVEAKADSSKTLGKLLVKPSSKVFLGESNTKLVPLVGDPSSVLGRTARTAIKLIESAGRPMQIGELYSALQREGVAIGGKDPKSTLSARLSQSGRFVAVREKGWWMKGRPLPGLTPPIEPENGGTVGPNPTAPLVEPDTGSGNHEPPEQPG